MSLAHASLYDLEGRMLAGYDLNGQLTVELDLRRFAHGAYVLEVYTSGRERFHERIVLGSGR